MLPAKKRISPLSKQTFIERSQQILKFPSGVEQSAHNCSDRALQSFCDFAVLEILQVFPHNYGLVLWRQCRQGIKDALTNFLSLDFTRSWRS
jgi:hypothetical protein